MIKFYSNQLAVCRSFRAILVLSLCTFQFDCLAQASLKTSIEKGKVVYENECITCHMANGEGITGAFPPLANSDYFKDDVSKAINAILNGLEGELEVNGTVYYGVMDPVGLTNEETADVLNYIRNSWGNKANELTSSEIEILK